MWTLGYSLRSSFSSSKESMTLPDGFEDNLMDVIKKHAAEKDVSKKYLRLMYLFFGLGLIFGLLLTTTLQDVEFSILDRTYIINKVLFSIPLSAAILLMFGQVYKATMVRKGKEFFTEI